MKKAVPSYAQVLEQSKNATTISEISKNLNVSAGTIKKIVSENTDYAQFMKRLKQNKRNNEEDKVLIVKAIEKIESTTEEKYQYVIDTCSVGGVGFFELIQKLVEENNTLYLCKQVITELDRLKRSGTKDSQKASCLLHKAVEDEQHYKCIPTLYLDTDKDADESIRNTCKTLNNPALITSDILMALYARCDGIKTIYLPIQKEDFKESVKEEKNEPQRLNFLEMIDGQCNVSMKNPNQYCKIVDNKREEYLVTDKPIQVVVGDHIYLATKKTDNVMSFAHYTIITEEETDNYMIVFTKFISMDEEIYIASKYQNFINEAVAKFKN